MQRAVLGLGLETTRVHTACHPDESTEWLSTNDRSLGNETRFRRSTQKHGVDMSYQPLSGGIQFREGFVVGVGAYATGLLLTISVALAGLHPQRGLWMQTGGFDVAEYLALYGIIHIPGYGGGLRGELLVNTVVTMFLLVGAGYLASRRASGTPGFRTGASIIFGYLTLVLLSAAVMAAELEGLTPGALTGPVFIAGGLYPVLFGGLGGLIAKIE